MPFGIITIGSETFEPSRPGVYPKTGSSLSTCTNELRLTPASRSSKAKRASISVTNIEQQDYTPVGSTFPIREEAIASINLQLPVSGSFTETELVALVNRVASTLTADRIRRMLNGES